MSTTLNYFTEDEDSLPSSQPEFVDLDQLKEQVSPLMWHYGGGEQLKASVFERLLQWGGSSRRFRDVLEVAMEEVMNGVKWHRRKFSSRRNHYEIGYCLRDA